MSNCITFFNYLYNLHLIKMLFNDKHCMGYLCWLFVMGLCLLLITLGALPYAEYNNFDEEICHITNVTIPTELPSYNSTTGWKNCDCGKRCTAWTPCISLYSSINPYFIIRNDLYSPNEHPDCTFYDSECNKGEDARYTVQKMEEAQSIMQQYLDQNVTCYVNNDASQIYLYKSYKFTLIIMFAIFILMLIFCGGCYCYSNYKNNKILYKNNPDNQKKKYIVEYDMKSQMV